jgi:hypothetical protein
MLASSIPKESWKDIVGYEGIYQVSDLGRVRSIDRQVRDSRGVLQAFRGKILKPNVHADGYHVVNLQTAGRIRGRLVSRLVAEAFCGPLSGGLEVNHKDGIKSNNRADNLECVTAKENCQHRDRCGLRVAAKGSRHGHAILDEQTVGRITFDLKSMSGVSVAKKYGVSPSTISLIRRGKTWKHVTPSKRKDVTECTV